MQPVKESEREKHSSGSNNNNGINNTHNNYWTKSQKKLIDKYQNQMNYRLIPLIPTPEQSTVKMPLITCPDVLSDIEARVSIPFLDIKPKPSTLRSYPENPWSITSNWKLKSASEKYRMPVKVFPFMFFKERSNPLNLNNLHDHFYSSFFYFRPAINKSIKSDSDLRQYLIDSLTNILLDYYVKKDALETSNKTPNIPAVNADHDPDHHSYYKFRESEEPILSHKRFLKDYQQKVKLCLAYRPNSQPLVPLLENLINVLTFGGELKEVDGFINFFESETHTAISITRKQITDEKDNIDNMNLKHSKFLNEKILYLSNSTIKFGVEHIYSKAHINFIPGISTYDLVDPPPPSYQESLHFDEQNFLNDDNIEDTDAYYNVKNT
ncbi:hypothetical protein BN7_4157 [Wickerhamomyces ciferrii]|uniref:Uncharacterized protein n=1 Tax=Wickerhamomyces ciferrii (strain ATCC 14091 / BCRC 22168 / CBS 111 / JCM 3599 / NBRC 0793 / NRRL Y-1031 F-60-10) TaxID=1206466 RepID=K0KH96_WICCF|nr:uncharacterized protein BN7_4157 [Wickerhamomyces ciferrii]CCH44590.1 hypothetical protein BN7_4157 [Wickerhamomyces ciferrii]